MRLIDAPIGIFRFDGELVLKTEYYSEDKKSGKYIPDCYIIRTGEYFWGGTKTANELINLDIEPVDFAELLPTVTDTISRQAAIDEIKALYEWHDTVTEDRTIDHLKRLPSAQPERKTAKWIVTTSLQEGQITWKDYKCSNCSHHRRKPMNFCEVCGRKMER